MQEGTKLTPKDMERVLDHCRKNGPKLAAAISGDSVKMLDDAFAVTNLEAVEAIRDNNKDMSKNCAEPLSGAIVALGNAISDLLDFHRGIKVN